MKQGYESIEWDAEKNSIVITTQEHIEIKEATSINDAETRLKKRLSEIVAQVKGLKIEAENIKSLLAKIGEKKAGSIEPAPVPVEESQLSPAE